VTPDWQHLVRRGETVKLALAHEWAIHRRPTKQYRQDLAVLAAITDQLEEICEREGFCEPHPNQIRSRPLTFSFPPGGGLR
jgi:hypothetical protein